MQCPDDQLAHVCRYHPCLGPTGHRAEVGPKRSYYGFYEVRCRCGWAKRTRSRKDAEDLRRRHEAATRWLEREKR